MNIRRRSKIRDMLEQLVPVDEPGLEEAEPLEDDSSLLTFLRHWQEDPTFLEVFERLWNRLVSPEVLERNEGRAKAVRVFTEDEDLLLSTEARGYLVRLHTAGVLTTRQLETVIDRAFECWSDEVGLDQVRFLVSAVLLHEIFGTGAEQVNVAFPPVNGLD